MTTKDTHADTAIEIDNTFFTTKLKLVPTSMNGLSKSLSHHRSTSASNSYLQKKSQAEKTQLEIQTDSERQSARKGTDCMYEWRGRVHMKVLRTMCERACVRVSEGGSERECVREVCE